MKFITRWLRRRRHRTLRQERIDEIEALGFELFREDGAAFKRYFLRTLDGEVLDNDGMGWASSSEAHVAAKKMAPLPESPE